MAPLRARAFLWAVVLGAGALQVWLLTLPFQEDRGGAHLGLAALLVALGVLAQHFPLLAGPGRKVDTAVAVYLAMVLLFAPAAAAALTGLAQLLGQGALALRRDRSTGRRSGTRRMVLFNTAQYMLAAGTGGMLSVVWGPGGLLPGWWLGDAIRWVSAAVGLYVVNTWAVALMVALQRGTDPVRVWRTGRGADLLQFGALFAVGLATALLAERSPWSPLLMAAPAAIVHASLKRMLAALEGEREARAAADAALRVRDEFISVAAHELKSPLTGLLGYTHLLLRRGGDGLPDPEELRDTLEIIRHQARKLGRLVGLLLDSVRIGTG
jgi:signal transduction histidine kinase